MNPLVDKPEGEPQRAAAGDTWTWKRSDLGGDFPTADYVLSYALKRAAAASAPVIITATENGSAYEATLPAADTANLTPGVWNWDAYMTRSSDAARVKIGSGQIEVTPNFASSSSDTRSHARKMLAAIEALLEGRSTADVNSYSIKDRSLTKMTPQELMEWRNYYRREVQREESIERARNGKATGRTSAVRFWG